LGENKGFSGIGEDIKVVKKDSVYGRFSIFYLCHRFQRLWPVTRPMQDDDLFTAPLRYIKAKKKHFNQRAKLSNSSPDGSHIR
jgi:hypothetical protein